MKQYSILMIAFMFFIGACSNDASDTLPVMVAAESAGDAGAGSGVDYSKYQNLDIDAYRSFDSMPSELKSDVNVKAFTFVSSLDTFKNSGSSASLYATLKSVTCLLYHCWKPMVSCVLNRECRAQLMSLGNCTYKTGDRMMTCFIAAFSQPNEKLLQMMSCMGGSGCLPEPVPNCPVPTTRSRIAPVTLADLEGDWYVVRGLSAVYDCWPGQRYTFRQVSETVSTYDYVYFPVSKTSPVAIQCTTTAIPFAAGETEIYPGRFRVNYTAYGMPGVDDWFCLSHPNPNYLLIYYCGASAMDSYVGGIVLSRTLDTFIPEDVLDDFADALANAGISDPVTISDFRTPDNSGITY